MTEVSENDWKPKQKSNAEHIRNAFDCLGSTAKAKDIISLIQEKENVTVSPQQIANIRQERKPELTIETFPISSLKRLKILVDEVGSFSAVRNMLDALEELYK